MTGSLIAGHITTTALLGNTVLCLDTHPQLWAQLHTDRSLVDATIEEVLRYRSPFAQVGRVTTVETELGGQIIPADALVSPWLLSANRDEREFPDPDRFDIHRTRYHHLGFGYGIHFCIGQLLARIEARVVIGGDQLPSRPPDAGSYGYWDVARGEDAPGIELQRYPGVRRIWV